MGELGYIFSDHVASSRYFVLYIHSKVYQYSLVIIKYLCCHWQRCFPFLSNGDKPLLVQLLQLLSLAQQFTTVILIKVNLWKVPDCWLC